MISVDSLKHDITEAKVNGKDHSNVQSRGPSPNRGSSLADHKAQGASGETQKAWREARGIDRSKQVKLKKLAHMRYQHPDLQEITTFLRDFGMTVVKKTDNERWYRGYGPDQYVYYARQGDKTFLGGTFEVDSMEELEKISRISDARILNEGVQEMTDAPGGGHILSILDPEGFPLNFIYGQKPATINHKPERLLVNDEVEKPRRKAFQRFEPGPAEVHKLGHFGLCVNDFPSQMDWYTRNFNLSPSDILYIPGDVDSSTGKPTRVPVAIFAHVDREKELTDHHTLFLTTLAPTSKIAEKHVHHCSFEVHDLDTQQLGHKWLAGKGYKSVWGVGRHILGSQLFDYWWDTTGFMVEHYADGDLVDEDTPVGYGLAADEGLAAWGPEVPSDFLD